MMHHQVLSLPALRCLAGLDWSLPPVWHYLHTLAHQAEASDCAIRRQPYCQVWMLQRAAYLEC